MKTLTATDRQAVELAVSRLDFEKIAVAMKAVNWEWHFIAETHVPNAEEVEDAARELAREALTKDAMIQTGGIRVTASLAGTTDPRVKIEFILDEADNEA
jgi:hypothetical protein